MKKNVNNYKKLLLIAVIALTGMTFSSCSNDDDEENDSPNVTETLDNIVKDVKYTITDED